MSKSDTCAETLGEAGVRGRGHSYLWIQHKPDICYVRYGLQGLQIYTFIHLCNLETGDGGWGRGDSVQVDFEPK